MIINTNYRQHNSKPNINKKNKKKKRKEISLEKIMIRRKKQATKLKLSQQRNKSGNEVRFIGLLMELGEKFVWQQPFYDRERYVCVDFYFPEQNIVIELDGPEHLKKIQKDRKRTDYLKRVHGVKRVIRYTNEQLALDYNKVLESVDYELCKCHSL